MNFPSNILNMCCICTQRYVNYMTYLVLYYLLSSYPFQNNPSSAMNFNSCKL